METEYQKKTVQNPKKNELKRLREERKKTDARSSLKTSKSATFVQEALADFLGEEPSSPQPRTKDRLSLQRSAILPSNATAGVNQALTRGALAGAAAAAPGKSKLICIFFLKLQIKLTSA